MRNEICNSFESYIRKADNIFDIMAAACKLLQPFEAGMSMTVDSDLENMVSGFAEQYTAIYALADLKNQLVEWLHSLYEKDDKEIKGKLFCLVRLIDGKCAKSVKSPLPDIYIYFSALNVLFRDEIMILPRPQGKAMELLSNAISGKNEYGFYGRNYARTGGASGYMHNFIVYRSVHDIMPRICVPNYSKKLEDEFEQKGYKLVVAVFPLSNRNLNRLFQTETKISGGDGTFCISGSNVEQEDILLGRCISALEICRDHSVDLAVFPEMLFTERNQKEIMEYIRQHESEEKRFPWFTWLGTEWSRNENKCMVVDQYGNEVFVQRKRIPYEYRENAEGKTVRFREEMSRDREWIINFLDLSDFFRIATAICRDISDDYLKAAIKELYSDIVIIPAFSESDRLTDRNIRPLAADHVNTFVCNACSACCAKNEEKYAVSGELLEKRLPFCYLCISAKQTENNTEIFYPAKHRQPCTQCENGCRGFCWEISFAECMVEDGKYTAKVRNLET